MDPETEQVVKRAEEAFGQAEQEPDPEKAKQLLEEAVKQLEALREPPQHPLQKLCDKLKELSEPLAPTEAVSQGLPDKIRKQMEKAGLPPGGVMPFHPKLDQNKKGEPIISKETIQYGPRKGKKGYVDSNGKIWIRDKAHGKYPDHWDIQENGGKKGRTRADDNGNLI
jgi:hypothetical protein